MWRIRAKFPEWTKQRSVKKEKTIVSASQKLLRFMRFGINCNTQNYF